MNLPKNILSAMEILKTGEFESYVVGGCVRDAMMGLEPHDYDLTTSATPLQTLEIFKDYRIIETGLKHGTVTVVIDGENIEITTFRIDGEYTDNRHPDSVEFTVNLAEDLSRRDFTVNAMAYNPDSGLVDLFSGMDDLKKGVIRCVGDADMRFNEDGLRILRALRFSSQLGFKIDDETSESIFRNKELLENISRERIYSEFTKLLCGKNPAEVVNKYRDVIREFIYCPDEAEVLSVCRPDKFLRYACFLLGCDNPSEQLKSLRADNETIKTVLRLCECMKRRVDSVISVKYLMRDYGEEFCLLFSEFLSVCGGNGAFVKSTAESLRGSCVSLKTLAVTGEDLRKIGVEPGRRMGDILNMLLDAVIRDEIPNSKTEVLEFAKSVLDNSCCP